MVELQKIFLNFIYLILGFGKFEIEMVAPNGLEPSTTTMSR